MADGQDIEVIEVGVGHLVELVHEDPDPLAGAVVVSVTPVSSDPRPPAATTLDDLADVEAPIDVVGVLARTAPGLPARFRPASHRHDQDVPATHWLIAHDLPFTPAGVQVTGDQDQRIFPAGVFHTPGQTRIEFAYPVAGYADLS